MMHMGVTLTRGEWWDHLVRVDLASRYGVKTGTQCALQPSGAGFIQLEDGRG
jgi:hypothetical protein